MNFCATCRLGTESLVGRELSGLGIGGIRKEDGRVLFEGDWADLVRTLLWLRTAERVLLVVDTFPAVTFDELFERVRHADLKPFLRPDSTIHVTGKSAKSTLFSVSDCQRITKKAAVENLKAAYGRRDVPEGGPEIILEVGILRDQVTLALDACGAGLSRRGYRTYNVEAPLSETLGAAILMLMRYRREMPLLDPMCGSGTMPIEAAMMAGNIAPGLTRSFAAENWFFLDPKVFADARAEARDLKNGDPAEITGSDVDPACIALCKKHAKQAGVRIEWGVRDAADLPGSTDAGILVCNPPYGDRLLDRKETVRLYRVMRESFDRYPQYRKGILSAVPDFERIYGQRADRRRKLSNGGIPCTLYQYDAPFRGRNGESGY